MPTKKFLKKKNNITKKNKQSGGFSIYDTAAKVGQVVEFADKFRPSHIKARFKANSAAKEEKKKNKSDTNTSSKKKRLLSMKIPKFSNPFGPSVAAQGAAILHKEQLESEKKEKHKANIELVMKAKKGLDKYKEKGDFLYKLSEKANEDDESHQFIKNNLYYLTLGILETAYDAYDYESKEGKKDEDKEIIKKNINDLTKINNYTNEFENHPKIKEKVIFDQLDLIKMLNNKQKATLKANLFILSLSDLKFKGKEKNGYGNDERSILNIIPTNPAKKNEEQNGGGEVEKAAAEIAANDIITTAKSNVGAIKSTAATLVSGATNTAKDKVGAIKSAEQEAAKLVENAMNKEVENITEQEAAATEEVKEEKKTNPNQPLLKQNASRNHLQDADRKLITRPKELTQYIEGEGNEAFQTGRPGDNRLDFEQNIFLKKLLLQQ